MFGLTEVVNAAYSILSNAAGNAGGALVGAVGYYLVDKFRERQQFGHLNAFLSKKRRLHISLPQMAVSEWNIHGSTVKASQPSNVPVMPMAEGGATARLVIAIQRCRRGCVVDFHLGHRVEHGDDPLICIGGPSVNQNSRKIIAEHFPLFDLKYPEHQASYDGMTFIPKRNPDSSLADDYGFIFVVKNNDGSNMVVLCGIWGTGTEMAVKGLIDLNKNKHAVSVLNSPKNCFFVVKGKIDDFQTKNIVLFQSHVIE